MKLTSSLAVLLGFLISTGFAFEAEQVPGYYLWDGTSLSPIYEDPSTVKIDAWQAWFYSENVLRTQMKTSYGRCAVWYEKDPERLNLAVKAWLKGDEWLSKTTSNYKKCPNVVYPVAVVDRMTEKRPEMLKEISKAWELQERILGILKVIEPALKDGPTIEEKSSNVKEYLDLLRDDVERALKISNVLSDFVTVNLSALQQEIESAGDGVKAAEQRLPNITAVIADPPSFPVGTGWMAHCKQISIAVPWPCTIKEVSGGLLWQSSGIFEQRGSINEEVVIPFQNIGEITNTGVGIDLRAKVGNAFQGKTRTVRFADGVTLDEARSYGTSDPFSFSLATAEDYESAYSYLTTARAIAQDGRASPNSTLPMQTGNATAPSSLPLAANDGTHIQGTSQIPAHVASPARSTPAVGPPGALRPPTDFLSVQAQSTSSAQLATTKALNYAFSAGKEAMMESNWDAAIERFQSAGEIDPAQHVVWDNLADAYVAQAKTKTGADQQSALDKAGEAYRKALAIKPDDSAYHNNYALVLAQARQFGQAQAELSKAAQLDPGQAGKYYYNFGALLVNTGQTDQAVDAFQKAIEIDPKFADAHYQYGLILIGKITTAPDGKIVPPIGTKDAFQKYLELRPDGPRADFAKRMLRLVADVTEMSAAPPSPPPVVSGANPQRIRVGGNVQAAMLITNVTPVYPGDAKEARIQGTVRMSAVIGEEGRIQSLALVSGHPLLAPAAIAAVEQWVYKPTLLNGHSVEVITQIDVNFTLSQ